MSPEQVRGEETDARSDIYSLGILLYEMLTGCVPFNSTSEYELMRCQIEDAPTPPRTHAPQIPLPVEQAIMRSLAKKREARYQSAAEFRAMLMRRNTGAVTRPLDDQAARTGGYAAPKTKADRPTDLTPPSSDIVKATRLAGDQNLAQAATGGEVKATRLGQPDAAPAYSQSPRGYYAPPPVSPDPGGQASFLSKLNWKHYAGAGLALVAMIVAVIAGTLALVGGSKPLEVQPAATSAPPAAQSPPVQSEPPAVPAQNGQALPAPPAATSGGSGDTTPTVATPPGASTGHPRAASPKTADTPSVSQPAPPAQTSPQTQPPPKQEKVAASKPEPDKKEAEKKPEEKKRSIFGKLKDAIVGGGDKKKDPKKP
jgi:serine/threonine protein kinase